MASANHVVVCGSAPYSRRTKSAEVIRLDLNGNDANIDLEIIDISKRLSTDVPELVTDTIEIATYVYCADQMITRGGQGVDDIGANWRRTLVFHIPVRCPSVWSSKDVTEKLQRILEFLSDDSYDFHFSQLKAAPQLQQYLEFEEDNSAFQSVEEVVLFSGGLDSLGGAVREVVTDRRRTALVSHRSTPKIYARQKLLLSKLKNLCRDNPPLHVPVWVHKREMESREYTQRSRSFLYAALAFAVARIFRLDRIRFYENGVVSLNLPISEQAVGSRATRTTHPRTLRGFADLFSCLCEKDFQVENPFIWKTKTEIVDLAGDAGCGALIGESTSCMHTHAQTTQHPHCGRPSQCVWRRFAVLASRYASDDPGGLYAVDLLTGARLPQEDLTLVESFIRVATELGCLNEYQLLERFGELSRVLRPLAPLSSDQVGDNIVILFKRHAKELASVLDAGLGMYASGIREGTLPKSCAIVLAVSETYRGISEPRIGTPLPTHSPAENGRNKPLLKPEEARAATVQTLINELNVLKPQRLRTKPNMTAFAASILTF